MQFLQEYMARYGYQPLEVPLIEPASLFLTKAGDQIIERLFTFEHRGKTLALRPEFTASAVDYYIRHYLHQKIVRWQFSGVIFEDAPGSQHYQRGSIGAELIGLSGHSADAEIIGMAACGLQTAGLANYQLVIGHVGLTRKLLQSFQLDDRSLRFLLNHRLQLRTVGKTAVLEQLDHYLNLRTEISSPANITSGVTESRAMGGRSREDIARRLIEKQQRTSSLAQILEALDFLDAWGKVCAPPSAAFAQVEHFIGDDENTKLLLNEWRSLIELLHNYGIIRENILIQPDLARSWDYYTGVVFELHGMEQELLAGGGRYDELIRLMGGGENIPAVGFAYHLDALRSLIDKSTPQNYSVSIGGEDAVNTVTWAQRLREMGITVEVLPNDYTIQVMDAVTVQVNNTKYTLDDMDRLIKTVESLPV